MESVPPITGCCGLKSGRLGMVFISIVSIITGCATLTVITAYNGSYKDWNGLVKTIVKIEGKQQCVDVIMNQRKQLFVSLAYVMACLFIIGGFILLYASLLNSISAAEITLWLYLFAVIIGFILFVCTSLGYFKVWGLYTSQLVVSLIAWFAYLISWLYYMIIINTYILYEET